MFCESVLTQNEKIINRSELQLADNLSTDPQAEILISNIIKPKYIKYVYFEESFEDAFILNNLADGLQFNITE